MPEYVYDAVFAPLQNVVYGHVCGGKLLSALLMQRFSDMLFISYIATDKTYRRHGAAGALLMHAMRQAERHRLTVAGEITEPLWTGRIGRALTLLPLGAEARAAAEAEEADALGKLKFYSELGFSITSHVYDVPEPEYDADLRYRIFSWPAPLSGRDFTKLRRWVFANIYRPTDELMMYETRGAARPNQRVFQKPVVYSPASL